jgi:hypothetical protein
VDVELELVVHGSEAYFGALTDPPPDLFLGGD